MSCGWCSRWPFLPVSPNQNPYAKQPPQARVSEHTLTVHAHAHMHAQQHDSTAYCSSFAALTNPVSYSLKSIHLHFLTAVNQTFLWSALGSLSPPLDQ